MNNYDCEQCTETTKKMRGCEGEETASEGYFINDKIYSRCPKKLHDLLPDEDQRLIWKVMTTYYYVERGLLMKAGGVEDQDPVIMSLIPIVHTYVERESERKMKAQTSKPDKK